jgi:hypothetical protein
VKKVKTWQVKKIFLVATAALLLLFFNSCAKKISFQTSSVVPAAKGTVKVSKDKNKNYNIKLSISNLAEPAMLQPSKKTYVIWMVTEINGVKNIGQINTSTGFLSSKLKANFETVSSFKPIKIFITAEDDANITYPGMQMVLTTNNF